MKKLTLKALTAALAVAVSVALPAAAQDASGPILFTNVNVFDGVNEALIKNANVVVTDNLITAVSTEPLAVAGGRVIDGGGRTLMPGLIDAHVHLSLNMGFITMYNQLPDYVAARTLAEAQNTLMRGFTSVRDTGGQVLGALSGNKHTKEQVIRREIQTQVGEPLDLDLLVHDLVRLENLSVFADVRVEAEDAGSDGVKLLFVFRESPPFIPFPAYTYTEENGFSFGAALSGGNIDGRAIRLVARAFFGGTTQYWMKFNWPWAWGNDHQSIDAFVARLDRDDLLRGFEERSTELTPTVGRYLGEHGRLSLSYSNFRMQSNVPGITVSPDNDDTLHRMGVKLGLDTRDSWGNPRRGWKNELEVWKSGGFLGGVPVASAHRGGAVARTRRVLPWRTASSAPPRPSVQPGIRSWRAVKDTTEEVAARVSGAWKTPTATTVLPTQAVLRPTNAALLARLFPRILVLC